MKKIFTMFGFVALAAVVFSSSAQAESTTGVVPPDLPQVEKPVAPTVTAPAATTAATAAAVASTPAPPPDPCASYKASPDAYTICQDRVIKIQRMMDARTARVNAAKEAAKAATEADAAAKKAAADKKAGKGKDAKATDSSAAAGFETSTQAK